MAVQNDTIADLFERYADLLGIDGANPFRTRAYRNAAEVVRGSPKQMGELLGAGEDLSDLHGIGKDLAAKIAEVVETGRLSALEEIEARLGPELADLLRIPGVGPKRVKQLHRELGVDSPASLAAALREGRVAALPGFGARTAAAMQRALDRALPEERRIPWAEAEGVVESLLAYLKELPGVSRVAVAGSFRRRRETIGDLDLLVTCRPGTPVSDRFVAHEEVSRVVSHGEGRSTVILASGLQVDLRVVPAASYGAALQYFTGSKAHNIAFRTRAVRRKLKVNEYGVFRGEERVAGRTEKEVYASLELPYIEPELREDRGEIEAALAGKLPKLVRERDLRGELRCHSRAGGGRSSLEALAEAARDLGWAYLAVTDPAHAGASRGGAGLAPKPLRAQLGRIEALNRRLADDGARLELWKGAEVEILEDGGLDLPDALLDELDWVVGVVRRHTELPAERQTERLLRALEHPRLHLLAHPTGRRLDAEPRWALDADRLVAGAAGSGTALELCGRSDSPDLSDVHARAARDAGVPVVLTSAARSADELGAIRLALGQARRAWLGKADVLNTRSAAQLRRQLRSR